MGKNSYRKFMKQERAKVKLKNKEKTLLPKGQNVTDLNFKVKKIVIKSQLKDHEKDEILSNRKLNLQEVLSRLGHYSASVSTEAVNELESLVKAGGRSFLSSHLSSVITQLSKLLTSPHAYLRKASIKLLGSVVSQVDDSEWSVVSGTLVSYIVCGLSHVNPGVRSDSLTALGCLPPSALSADVLLSPLLDVMSTSRAGGRTLSTPLSSSPTNHRNAVLSRIRSVLSSLHNSEAGNKEVSTSTDLKWEEGQGMRVPLIPCYSRSGSLSISEYSPVLSTSSQLDLKEFATSLIPLMMDSFAEIAPEPDISEAVSLLTSDGMKLLATISEVMLLLYDIFSLLHQDVCWLRDKFGSQLYKRLMSSFPYSETVVKKERSGSKGSRGSPQLGLRANLTLALVALYMAPKPSVKPVIHFLSGILRSNVGLEEANLLERCLSTCLSLPSVKSSSDQLLTSLTHVKRSSAVYKQVFSVLCGLVRSEGCSNPALSGWVESLLREVASPNLPLYQDTLQFLACAAPTVHLPNSYPLLYVSLLEKAISSDSENAITLVSDLLYWVESYDSKLLDLLQQLVQNEARPSWIRSHVTNLISHRCCRYPDTKLTQAVQRHFYWQNVVTVL